MQPNLPKPKISTQLIQYWINWLAGGFATGQWDSFFLGRGFDFQGIAPFSEDPDLVRINWQASLTLGELQVSQFSEERNVNIYILGNQGASMAFGSQVSKHTRLALLTALISFAGLKLKDSFQYFGYTDKVIAPDYPKSIHYPITLARNILDFEWQGKGSTGLYSATQRISPQRSLVIIISDFLTETEALTHTLRQLVGRHEILPLVIWDPLEVNLPSGFGIFPFVDLQSGEQVYLLLTNNSRRLFTQNAQKRREDLEKLFRQFGVKPHFMIGGTSETDLKTLMKIFFGMRRTL